MHAYILLSREVTNHKNKADKLAAKQKAKILPFKVQKIEDVRNLRELTKLSFSQKTAVYIENIDQTTTEAQNAFLKSLEEPQENIIYILTANNLHNVIETVQSRCEVIKITGEQTLKAKDISKTKKFDKANIDTKFEILGSIKDRFEAIGFVEDLIFLNHQERNFENMETYLKTLKNLKSNGNVSLQLTNMLVSSLSPRYN